MDAFPAASFEVAESEPAWLAFRRQGIGSSDTPAILGAPGAHRSAYEIFYDKLGIDGLPPDAKTADLMAWGRILEAPILQRFEAVSGCEVLHLPRWHGYVSRVHPWLRATLDALAFREDRLGPGVVEVKWAPFTDPDDALRPSYQAQHQHQLAAVGAAWGIIVVLARTELVSFEQDRHEGFITALIPYLDDWWRKVERREAPEPDGSPGTLAAILARFPVPTPGYIKPLPDEMLACDAARQDALAQAKKWEAVADAEKARIVEAIGEAEAGVLADGTVFLWRLRKRAGHIVSPGEYRDLRRRPGPLDLSGLLETLHPLK